MEDFFCCPICGSKKLRSHQQTEPDISDNERRLCWSCANCGNEFFDFSHYTATSKQLQKRGSNILIAFTISGGVLAIIIYFALAALSVSAAILAAFFVVFSFFLLGIILKSTNEKAAEKIDNELQKTKNQMEYFNKQIH